jgi:hypothetical protein
MSTLSRELDRYLTIRRGLGYDLGTAERILRRFIAFAEHEGADLISTALFLRWQGVQPCEPAHMVEASWHSPSLCPVDARYG